MSIAAMIEMARKENIVARKRWDVGGGATSYRKNITTRIKPYIGSGMTQTEVARALDCAVPSVTYALKKMGAKL